MNDARRRELDRLLARGGVAGPAQDEMLDAILRASAPQRSLRARIASWRWRFMVPAFAALIAVPLVLVRRPEDAGGFRAKGAGGTAARVEVGCANGCAVGSTLQFSVQPTRERAFLAAYAIAPDGTRVWYFPSNTGELPQIDPSETVRVLPRGVRLAGPVGAYEEHLLLLRAPMSRDALILDPSAEGISHDVQRLELAR